MKKRIIWAALFVLGCSESATPIAELVIRDNKFACDESPLKDLPLGWDVRIEVKHNIWSNPPASVPSADCESPITICTDRVDLHSEVCVRGTGGEKWADGY
jgi:hypothetical protein